MAKRYWLHHSGLLLLMSFHMWYVYRLPADDNYVRPACLEAFGALLQSLGSILERIRK